MRGPRNFALVVWSEPILKVPRDDKRSDDAPILDYGTNRRERPRSAMWPMWAVIVAVFAVPVLLILFAWYFSYSMRGMK